MHTSNIGIQSILVFLQLIRDFLTSNIISITGSFVYVMLFRLHKCSRGRAVKEFFFCLCAVYKQNGFDDGEALIVVGNNVKHTNPIICSINSN